ncbi:transglutaminase domain protein [Pirellula staleyi DSM 6068]|uniref:Transglutaminase domain protein n=1 Tax=Pirellula staleyi (strain ATCC 27377 / DSM 6068 / ICPB 4128) TaxID=530564 RepID=D2QY52_PIRSD|nr:transglutaminase family protein [Pirellula staleyi]ADB16266.1 transglutaminase domain protein [Pirellula staleyi DSM 6068]
MNDREPYLKQSRVIDVDHPDIVQLARSLQVAGDEVATSRRCFEWVRDEIRHSRDFQANPATCRASQVLQHRTGYCYAKSHLLVALLRACGIPAGFCYQRLSVNDHGGPYCLHGYAAIWLEAFGWYRVDPRGNKPGVEAQFDPPVERLAFPLQSREEYDFENIFAEPLESVLSALQSSSTWQEVLDALPDVKPEQFDQLGLKIRRQGPQATACNLL